MKKALLLLTLALILSLAGCTENTHVNDIPEITTEVETAASVSGVITEATTLAETTIETTLTETTLAETTKVPETTASVTEKPISAAPEAEGKCGDNLTWSYSDGTLTISGTGEMEDYTCTGNNVVNQPWADLEVTDVVIDNGCTEIGDYAFYRNKALKSVSIPNTVEEIGQWAFCECISLESLILPDSVEDISTYAFADCRGLKSVTLGSNIEFIRSGAFYNCKNLESLTIPDSAAFIYDGAFYNVPHIYYNGRELDDGYCPWGALAIN